MVPSAVIRFMSTGEKHVFDAKGTLTRVLQRGERLPRRGRPGGQKRSLRTKKFPAPSVFGTGNHLLALVAGARVEHQKTPFPPLEVVEIPLERRGTVLVPVAA